MFGLGATIGAGIFVLTGVAAKEKAGPSVTLSFLFDGLVCILSALTYAECASRVPVCYLSSPPKTNALVNRIGLYLCICHSWRVSGILNRLGCIFRGMLPSFSSSNIWQYGFSVSTVARGWSGYVRILVTTLTGQLIPTWLYDWSPANGIHIDMIAGISVLAITMYIMLGMKSSAVMNNVCTRKIELIFVDCYRGIDSSCCACHRVWCGICRASKLVR